MARIGIGEFLKKRLGSSSSRDPRVTWSGTFGTEGSRKKQTQRLSESPTKTTPKSAASQPSYMQRVSDAALRKYQDKQPKPRDEVAMGTAPASKTVKPDAVKKVPQATPTLSKAPVDTGRAREDIISSLGLDEDSAVAKAIRRRQSEGKALGAYSKGGHVKANGCAQRGKTRGRII